MVGSPIPTDQPIQNEDRFPMTFSRPITKLRHRLEFWQQRRKAMKQVRSQLRLLHGPAMTRLADDQVALVLVGRDVGYFLDHHIRHHLAMGVSHVVYIDNGSTDASIEIVKRFPNVTIASCTAQFHRRQRQIRYLANTAFLKGGWRLAIDPDELLDYPGSDRIDLPELTRRMTARGHNALVAQMLDMVHDGPISETAGIGFAEAERVLDRCSLQNLRSEPYHSDFLKEFVGLNQASNPDIAFLFGGLRRTVFGEDCCLTKHALFRMDRGVVPQPHPHVSTGVTCTDFSAVLRHYKFAGGVLERERKLLSENRISHGEMKLRVGRIESEGDINLGRYAECRNPDVETLVEKGFLKASGQALAMLA